jgi:hypothetical protein
VWMTWAVTSSRPVLIVDINIDREASVVYALLQHINPTYSIYRHCPKLDKQLQFTTRETVRTIRGGQLGRRMGSSWWGYRLMTRTPSINKMRLMKSLACSEAIACSLL